MNNQEKLEKIKILVESKGAELISTCYEGNKKSLLIKTADGVIETRNSYYLESLKNNNKKLYSKQHHIKKTTDGTRLSIDEVREIIKSKGGELLSTEYKNDCSPIKIKFPDGEIEERTLISIRHSNQLISKKQVIQKRANNKKLSIDEVRKIVESKGGELLSTEYKGLYVPILIKTSDGVVEKRKPSQIKKTKKLISKKIQKKNKSERLLRNTEGVREVIESKGGKLLSEYTGNHNPLLIKTEDGVVESRILSNIQRTGRLLSKSSSFEYEIFKFIESIYSGNIIKNDRTLISPAELDIVLPDEKIAIECNGIYWHSDQYKPKNYHLNKTKLVKEKGYDLIHITDSNWNLRQDIIKDIIKKKLNIVDEKIYARKCTISKIPYKELKHFLNDNHLQGYTATKYNYGLIYQGQLVSVMTFSKPRFGKNKAEFELCRYANKLGVSVVGGFSKLLKHFINENNTKSIITYCDIAYFTGKIYKQNNFKWINRSTPNYKYFTPNSFELYSRNKFQKHKLHKVLEKFDPNLTEYENMKNNYYFRIWDCGNDVYLYEGEQ